MPANTQPNIGIPLRSIKAKTAINPENKLTKFSVSNIEELKNRASDDLVFSFIPIDINHKAFNLGGTCTEWFVSLFDTLKEVSRMTWAQVHLSDHFNGHKHTWSKTNYTFEFDEETLEQFEGYQFSLSKSRGRIHGFLVGNRFYVYWLDPHHNMNDSPGYPGVIYKTPEVSCFQRLNEENVRLIQEIAHIENKIQAVNGEYDKFLQEHERALKEIAALKEEN